MIGGGYCILPSLAEIVIESMEIFTRPRARLEDGIASHVPPLFRLRDPHKTQQFSLHVVQEYKTVSKGMHEAYTSLKKDGYAFKVWYNERFRFRVPLPD